MGKSVAEQLIASIFSRLPVGTATAIGRRETAGHHSPPSAIAVPLGSRTIRQPDRPGDAKHTDVGRQMLVREFVIEWWCHGAPSDDSGMFGDAEDIYLEVVRAVRNVCHHSVEFSDERWVDQEDGGDGYERHGTTIVLTTTIAIPIYERRSRIVTLNGVADTTISMNDEEITE